MTYVRISARNNPTFQHQADAVLSQANPVSATLYTVLAINNNVRIISISPKITWAVTQPTPLYAKITIDGNALSDTQANPVSNTNYYIDVYGNVANGVNFTATANSVSRSFLLEGRSVKIEASITWAITQPTPLEALVKWAKR